MKRTDGVPYEVEWRAAKARVLLWTALVFGFAGVVFLLTTVLLGGVFGFIAAAAWLICAGCLLDVRRQLLAEAMLLDAPGLRGALPGRPFSVEQADSDPSRTVPGQEAR